MQQRILVNRVTLKEIARTSGLKYPTVWARVKSRKIPTEKIGNVILVKQSDVARIVQS